MSVFVLKIIAVIAMTFDHIQVFFPVFPIQLRWIGRVSIPIFIFCLIQAHVHSKNKHFLRVRLYIASVLVEFIFLCIGYGGNFLGELFLLMLLFHLIDISEKNWKTGVKFLSLYVVYSVIIMILVVTILQPIVQQAENMFYFFNRFFNVTSDVIFPVEEHLCLRIFGVISFYQVPFFALGALMYITRNDKKQFIKSFLLYNFCFVILTTTSLLSKIKNLLSQISPTVGQVFDHFRHICGFSSLDYNTSMNLFTENYQWMMIFALPILLLYNGEKGKSAKKFFYIFYPAHIVVLSLLSRFM